MDVRVSLLLNNELATEWTLEGFPFFEKTARNLQIKMNCLGAGPYNFTKAILAYLLIYLP